MFLFLFFFSFIRLGEGCPLPPLRITTLIQTRAPQQIQTEEELGGGEFLPYTTSYHLQRLCKTKGGNWSGARHKGERCVESRGGDSGRMERGVPHLDTLRSENSVEVPVTIIFMFFCLRSCRLLHSPLNFF